MGIFPTRILVATDGSREAELAVTTAADLAKSTDSELHVVHVGEIPLVYHPERHGYRAEYEEHEKEAKQLLEAQVERIKGAGATVVQAHLRLGRADEEIVDLAQSIGAGMIVMGSRGKGRIRRALMGSVADSVVRHAHCPVLVVRWKPVAFPAKILVATDGSQEALEAQVGRIAVAEGPRVQSYLRMGRPDEEIVALGEEIGAELIVIGSRG